jgi:hypothetical protein
MIALNNKKANAIGENTFVNIDCHGNLEDFFKYAISANGKIGSNFFTNCQFWDWDDPSQGVYFGHGCSGNILMGPVSYETDGTQYYHTYSNNNILINTHTDNYGGIYKAARIVVPLLSSATVTTGKLNCDDLDPACIQYTNQTRESIINRTRKYLKEGNGGGAWTFFNEETQRLEVYLPCGNCFTDVLGNKLE